MRKRSIIATISFLALVFAGCGNEEGRGPTLMLKTAGPTTIPTSPALSKNGKAVYSYHLGPYNVKADTLASDTIEKPGTITFKVEDPFWMTSFSPRVEDAEGNPLPNELVHQIILINHAEENTLCTTKQTGNPFAAATSTMNDIELPPDHGYSLMPNDLLEARVVLKNETVRDYNGIFISFVISGEPINGAHSMIDVRPIMVDLDPCEHKPISVPPGQFVEKTINGFSPETGSLIKAYGLLQNYGVYVNLNDKNGVSFWKGTAEIDEEYRIVELKPFEDPAGIKVERGDKLELTVAYDNATDQWYDSASGAALIFIARENENSSLEGSSKSISAKKANSILLD